MRKLSNSDALQYINESTLFMVEELSQILSKLSQRTLTVDYLFKHDDYESQSEASYSSNDSCSCLVDCSGFVLYQASQYDKHYSDYFASILDSDSQASASDSPPYFGSVASLSYASLFLRNSAVDYVKLEAGGGSGFGWQLYCDNILMITAGTGGGGGFAVDSTTRQVSFGGGGGGGLQLIIPDAIYDLVGQANTNSTYINSLLYQRYSIGGGGGCGVCELDNDPRNVCNHLDDDMPGSATITCGFKHDDDIDKYFTADLVTSLQNGTLLSKCHKLEVYGGGGGGGGTDLCCSPTQVGYGFAFSFTTSNHTQHHAERDDDVTSTTDSASSTASSEQASGSDSRYTYDIMGGILDQAGKSCPDSLNDWCCVCSHSQYIISTCLGEEDGEEDVSDDCKKIKDAAMRVSWILEQDCCPSYSSSSSSNNTSLIRNTSYSTSSSQSRWSKQQWRNYTIEPIPNLPGYNMIINRGENDDESSWNDVNPYLDKGKLSLTVQDGLLRFEESLQSCQSAAVSNRYQQSETTIQFSMLFGFILLLSSFFVIVLGVLLRRRLARRSSKKRDNFIALQYLPLYGSCEIDASETIVFV